MTTWTLSSRCPQHLTSQSLRWFSETSSSSSTNSSSLTECWSCHYRDEPEEVFCNKCGALQEALEAVDFFDMLRMEKKFDIELDELERQFRAQQRKLHPDKFVTRSETERAHSKGHSKLLNRAYDTLRDPRERALYLLRMHGVPTPEDETIDDPAFLMEAMERREAIDAARGDRKTLDRLSDELVGEQDKEVAAIAAAFAGDDFEAVRHHVHRLRYIQTAKTEVNDLSIGLK